MKFTYSWLKDYIKINLKPQSLADKLTMSGLEVESVERSGSDYIFEAEVTPNRMDLLSILGLAREAAAVLGKDIHFDPLSKSYPSSAKASGKVKINIQSFKDCPLYIARVIDAVKIKKSPEYIAKRLSGLDADLVNNIVDVTNFVLFETGQPLHAFDYEKVKGNIEIRRARRGEKILLINEKTYELNPDILVIADDEGPVAIAGIMGGERTKITKRTKSIFLESACFEPVLIRKATRFLSLSSDSSYRFERGVDRDSVEKASQRAASLIMQAAGGKLKVKGLKGKCRLSTTYLKLDTERLRRMLDVSIGDKEILGILRRLYLRPRKEKRAFRVKIPSFRPDIKNEEGLMEEVARIYGYNKIPTKLPSISPRLKLDMDFQFKKRLRRLLNSSGLTEVITYSFEDQDKLLNYFKKDSLVKISNPLRDNLDVLRSNLCLSLSETAKYNLRQGIERVALYEMADLYGPTDKGFSVSPAIGIVLSGFSRQEWFHREQFTFYHLKGIIEELLEKVGIYGYEFSSFNNTTLDNVSAVQIKKGKNVLGVAGRVLPEIAEDFTIYFAQVYINELNKLKKEKDKYESFSKLPCVVRDLTVVIPKENKAKDVLRNIQHGSYIKRIHIYDIYQGDPIPKDKKSITFRIFYGSDQATLTGEEADKVHDEIRRQIGSQGSFQVK